MYNFVRMFFWLLDYFIEVRQSTPLLGLFLKNIAFGPRSRYRKIPPSSVANQIAGKARIPPAHERKKTYLWIFIGSRKDFDFPLNIVYLHAVENVWQNQ